MNKILVTIVALLVAVVAPPHASAQYIDDACARVDEIGRNGDPQFGCPKDPVPTPPPPAQCTIGEGRELGRDDHWFSTDWWLIDGLTFVNCESPGAFISVSARVAPQQGVAAENGQTCGDPRATSCGTHSQWARMVDEKDTDDCFVREWEVGLVGGVSNSSPKGLVRECL